jgi:hypothetical protein
VLAAWRGHQGAATTLRWGHAARGHDNLQRGHGLARGRSGGSGVGSGTRARGHSGASARALRRRATPAPAPAAGRSGAQPRGPTRARLHRHGAAAPAPATARAPHVQPWRHRSDPGGDAGVRPLGDGAGHAVPARHGAAAAAPARRAGAARWPWPRWLGHGSAATAARERGPLSGASRGTGFYGARPPAPLAAQAASARPSALMTWVRLPRRRVGRPRRRARTGLCAAHDGSASKTRGVDGCQGAMPRRAGPDDCARPGSPAMATARVQRPRPPRRERARPPCARGREVRRCAAPTARGDARHSGPVQSHRRAVPPARPRRGLCGADAAPARAQPRCRADTRP